MCSRYEVEEEILTYIDGELVKITVRYKAEHRDHVERRVHHDVRPTNLAPLMISAGGDMLPTTARWGFQQSWALAKGKKGQPIINARSETVHDLRTFKEAFKDRRCIVPAVSWIEFEDVGHARYKRPWRFSLPSGPFGFAGLWEGTPGGELRFTVLTRAAGPATADIHDRMPVVLPEERRMAWLRGEVSDPGAEAIVDGWLRASDWPDEKGPRADPTPSLI
jgi:putative SOS response-associated peptidase YedK